MGPKDPGKGPENPAVCRGNCWYPGRVFIVEVDVQPLRACRAPQLMSYMASGSRNMSEQCVHELRIRCWGKVRLPLFM